MLNFNVLIILYKTYKMNLDEKEEFRQHVRTLSIIHAALCVGVTLAAAVMYYLQSQNSNPSFNDGADDIFMFIGPFILFTSIVASIFLYKTNLKKIKAEPGDFIQKLNQHKAASIIRYALVEGGALAVLVLFFISGATHLFLLSILQLIFLLSLKPSETKVRDDLELVP